MIMKRIVPWILPRISTSMRAPGSGIGGWFAMKLMEKGNDILEVKGIQRLQLESTDTFVEIGAGHGFGLRSLGNGQVPERIVCVDISPEFLLKLQQVREELSYGHKVEIYDVDCRDMPFLENSSVDKVFAMNVVYFLDPLSVYLEEFHRVIKPGGSLVFGGVFTIVPDVGAFVNAKEAPIVDSMEAAGFQVMSTPVFLKEGDPEPLYTELRGTKS